MNKFTGIFKSKPKPKQNAAATKNTRCSPKPRKNKAGIVSTNPIALVYILPRLFFITHLSDNRPPNNTPINEEKAIVMVETGPATDISNFKFSENKVGNQFLIAHPGKLGIAK